MNFAGEKHIGGNQRNEQINISEILHASWFLENETGLLALLEKSLGNEINRKKLIDILEKRSNDPVPLNEIIKISDSFMYLQEQMKGRLTEKDIKWINQMIKYFESWFYSGNWVHIPKGKEENPNAYAYFSVPAGIINTFTKIKDMPEYTEKIAEFDRSKLQDFWRKVDNFAEEFMSKSHLEQLKETGDEAEKKLVQEILKYRDTIKDLLKRSKGSVLREFKESGAGLKKINSGSKAQDLYFAKTCLIAATKLMEEKVGGNNNLFMPDLTTFQAPENNYERYDMSSGRDSTGLSKMHYHPLRLPYCKFVVKYLESLKN